MKILYTSKKLEIYIYKESDNINLLPHISVYKCDSSNISYSIILGWLFWGIVFDFLKY